MHASKKGSVHTYVGKFFFNEIMHPRDVFKLHHFEKIYFLLNKNVEDLLFQQKN